MQFIAARFAEKTMLMPISLLSMTTAGAALAGVFQVNPDHFHTEGVGLVADKLLQLIKGPAVEIRALLLSKFTPIANTAKRFYRNRRVAGVLGKFDDTAAHNMVHVSLKSPLSTGQPFQGAPRRAATHVCLFLLESSAGFGVAVAKVVSGFRRLRAQIKGLLAWLARDWSHSRLPRTAGKSIPLNGTTRLSDPCCLAVRSWKSTPECLSLPGRVTRVLS
jgi:hypothetical protein